jgi:type VI protein secretion system component Hcp
VDTFIWFDPEVGLAGQKVKPHPGGPSEFELGDWAFDVTNRSTIGSATGGAGGGKSEFGEFTITRISDRALPTFFRNCCGGSHYQAVKVPVHKAGPPPDLIGKEYLQFKFGTVFTTGVDWKHGDDGPSEDITFVYGKLGVQYTPQKPDPDPHHRWASPPVATAPCMWCPYY